MVYRFIVFDRFRRARFSLLSGIGILVTDSNGETKGKITLTGWFCLSLLIWLSFLYTSMYLQCVFVCFGFSFAADHAHLSFNCQTRVRAVGSLSFSLDPVYCCRLVKFFCVYVILNKYIYFLCFYLCVSVCVNVCFVCVSFVCLFTACHVSFSVTQ